MAGSPDTLTSWHSDWTGVTVAVVGLGEEGFALADTLAELGALTTVLTTQPDGDRQAILDVLGVDVAVVSDDAAVVSELQARAPDLIVISPDWEPDREREAELGQVGTTIWSDVEFSWRVADKHGSRPDVVFVAGAALATELADVAQRFLLHSGRVAARGGDDAPPVLDALRHPDGVDVVVWTLTPRQLWRMGNDPDTARRPRVSVGWDAPGSLEPEALEALYTDTVESCFYQPDTASEKALENASVIEGARAIGVVGGTPGMSDLGRVENVIVDRAFLPDRKDRALELCTLDELLDAGFHSPEAVDMAIAALGVARALGVAPELLGGALQTGQWPQRK